MSKHTPGPWQVDPQYPIDVQTADGKQEICVPFDEAQRDMSFTMPQTRVASGDEAFANARLIAKSPELLAALAWALPFADESITRDLSDGAVGMGEDLAQLHAAQKLLKELVE